MKKKIIALILILIVCVSFVLILVLPKFDNEPALEEGKWITTQDVHYTKHDSLRIDFNVVNTSKDTLYVQVSEWFMSGIASRFKWYGIKSLRGINILTYTAKYPSFVAPKFYLDDSDVLFDILLCKYIKLEPEQKQHIQIVLNKIITKRLSWHLNNYKFRIQMWYRTSQDWKEIKKNGKTDIERFVMQISSKSVVINIDKEGIISRSLLKDSERIDSYYLLPLKPGVVSEFILK